MKLKAIQNLKENDNFTVEYYSLQIEYAYFPIFNINNIIKFKTIASIYSCGIDKPNVIFKEKRTPAIINSYKINGIVFDYEIALKMKPERAEQIKANKKPYEYFKNIITKEAVDAVFKAFGIEVLSEYERSGISYIFKKERLIVDVIAVHRPSVIPETFKKTNVFDISVRKYILFKEYF